MNIYVGNLQYNMSEDELKSVFAEYGEVSSVKIIIDKETGRSRGFGFVTMSDDDSGSKAIEELNGAEVSGRSLRVNQAIEKNDNDRPQQRRHRIKREY